VFALICGYFFAAPLFVMNQSTIRHVISMMPLLLLFFMPAITMRLFSEEIKVGTIEILATQPVFDYEILLGKYLAATGFFVVTVACTLIFPVTLLFVGRPDIGQMFAQYIGVIFLGAMFAAIGTFSSTLTKNQIVAFIIGFLVCFVIFIVGKLTMFMPSFLVGAIDFIGIDTHFENISRGVIDTRDILYFVSMIVLFLYASLAVLKAKK
jgi:ABC-2 type transport system permease protein